MGCKFAGNEADLGGAIYGHTSELYMMEDSISRNTAYSEGGGIWLKNGSLSMYNTDIENNTANLGRKLGGGIALMNMQEALFQECTFQGNEADIGGGVHSSNTIDFHIDNCQILDNIASSFGGGLYLFNGTLLLENSNIYDNTANIGGGGIHFAEVINAQIVECNLFENKAIGGGAIFSQESELEVKNSEITNNKAHSGGGGICQIEGNMSLVSNYIAYNTAVLIGNSSIGGGVVIAGEAAQATIEGCDFNENTANGGGGVAVVEGAQATIEECNFNENTADLGGGLALGQFVGQIKRCNFNENTADLGGAIYSGESELDMTESSILNNAASISGGGIYSSGGSLNIFQTYLQNNTANVSGGALYNENSNFTQLYSCLLTNNSAQVQGSAIMNFQTDLYLTRVTVADNGEKAISHVHGNQALMTVKVSIIWNNGNHTLSDNIDCYTANPDLVNIGCSDIQGSSVWNVNILGNNNFSVIDADPLFVDPAGSDYHLTSSSPAIDPPCASFRIRVDIEGTPVFGDYFDMGCYEYVEYKSPQMPFAENNTNTNTNTFTIYPNPVQKDGIINMMPDEEMATEEAFVVELYSILGVRVMQKTTSDFWFSLPENISAGQYFLRIYSTDYTKTKSFKIVVQ